MKASARITEKRLARFSTPDLKEQIRAVVVRGFQKLQFLESFLDLMRCLKLSHCDIKT